MEGHYLSIDKEEKGTHVEIIASCMCGWEMRMGTIKGTEYETTDREVKLCDLLIAMFHDHKEVKKMKLSKKEMGLTYGSGGGGSSPVLIEPNEGPKK